MISLAFAQASNGKHIDLNAAMTLSYTANVLQYIETTQSGVTYRQTFTYTGSDLTSISQWVAQ